MLLICGILAACQPDNKHEEETARQTIDMTKVLDKQPKKVKLNKWAKSIRYIPLETNDSLLLSAFLPHIVMHDNQLLVHNKNDLYLFDLNGKFIRTIGKKGEGPKEFISPGSIWADHTGIHIADNEKWIKTYNWDGKWIKTVSIPEEKVIKEVLHVDNGRELGYVQNISGKEPIRMYIFNDSTVLDSIPYGRSFEPGKFTLSFYDECKIFNTPEGNYVKEMFNDTIYRITEQNKLVPRWVLDAGKYKLPEGARYALEDPTKSLFANAALINIIGMAGNTICLTAQVKKQNLLLVYDTKKGITENIILTYPENTFAFEKSKTFIPCFISDDARYLIGYESQENDENPVIILVER